MDDIVTRPAEEISREELYELVWQTPMSKLGPHLAMNGPSLASLCRKRQIPTPPLGYWQKKAVGRAPEMPPLPSFEPPPKTSPSIKPAQGSGRPPVPASVPSRDAESVAELPPFAEDDESLDHMRALHPKVDLSRFEGSCEAPRWPDLIPGHPSQNERESCSVFSNLKVMVDVIALNGAAEQVVAGLGSFAALDERSLNAARERLLETAVRFFSVDPAVRGVFLGGSLAAGSADAYSDIDLRVIVTAGRHAYYVDQRRELPKQWPGFLYNEWVPDAQHCVSHFRPFGKIDIFYYDVSALAPSSWYRLPIRILYDPEGIVADLIERSQGVPFMISDDDLDFSISKGLAAAHETYRRAQRGELFYALSLLDELRQHIMHADDWLHDRTPETAVMAKFDMRGSRAVLATLKASYCPCEADAILSALRLLAETYRAQVIELHDRFGLSRPLPSDLEALAIILSHNS